MEALLGGAGGYVSWRRGISRVFHVAVQVQNLALTTFQPERHKVE